MRIIKKKEGKLCVKFYQRSDGTMLTSDCPVGIKERAKWLWWKATTVTASFFALIFLSGCNLKSKKNPVSNNQPETKGEMTYRDPTKELLGDMACPPDKNDAVKMGKMGRIAPKKESK